MRLVSLAPSNTEILYALGLQNHLVAVTSFCNFPPEAKSLPRLPGWSTIKAADVLALKPDLVLTSSICQEELRAGLHAAGVRVQHVDPRSLEDVAQSFVSLAELLGEAALGQALAAEFRAGLEAFKAMLQSSPRPRLYIEEWDKPPMAAGNWVPEMALLAGAEPFNRNLGLPSAAINWEELMEFDPEIVLYSICGVGLSFDPAAFLKVEGWNTLSAAKTKKIYSVDDSYFNVPGPRLLQGLRILRDLCQGKAGVETRGLVA